MTSANNVIKSRTYTLTDVRDRIIIHGRSGETDGCLFFDHTAAGIEFTAYAQGEVKLSVLQTGSADSVSYYTIWIDGIRQEPRLCCANHVFEAFPIATFAEGGVHTIRVLKACEMGVSQSVFKELFFTGYLMDPPKKSDLYIEFLGDSITSGYGNVMYTEGVGDLNASPVSAVNSDGTQAWAFLTAEKLNARCTIVSDSGIGVVYEHGMVPGRRMFNFWRYNSYARQDLGKFKPVEAPNIIVINLGTNDRMNNTDNQAMVAGTKELITLLRTTYGKAIPIVWASGMMDGAKEEQVRQALNELGGEEAGLYSLDLIVVDAAGGGHPGPKGHIENANILVNFLTSKRLV